MTKVLGRDNVSTDIRVRIAGDYISHAELALLLDELDRHFFSVGGVKDNWEGPEASGSEIVMYIAIGGAVPMVTAILQELAKDIYGASREKVLDVFHRAAERKRQQRGEQPHLVLDVAGIKFLLQETKGPITQKGLAAALRQAAELLENEAVQPTDGPIETYPVLDGYADTKSA